MQAILGAGGVIGNLLAKALREYTSDIRLVSRNPRAVNEGDQLIKADLIDARNVFEALKDTKVAYLTVGLPYRAKIWQEKWPIIMENVINACKKQNVKLVFFDNIYMYYPQYLKNMTEDTPFNPISKKGWVRAEIANRLLEEMSKGNLQAAIARSADFYGFSPKTSVLEIMVFKNFAENKKANWFCSLDFKHSFTFTADAAKATAILGNSEKAYGETWHLPTASNPPTGKEWIELIAGEMKKDYRAQVVEKGLTRFLGLFNKDMKELGEMIYQYDREYVFNSAKFEKSFEFKPTDYSVGVKQVAREYLTPDQS